MARFPIYVDLTGKRVLVAGGGAVALRKVKTLIDFGAEIQVIGKDILSELENLLTAHGGSFEKRAFAQDDFVAAGEAFLVICATNDHELNAQIADYCISRRIPVNCADDPERSLWTFPAIVRRDDVVIGIGTSGMAPALAGELKSQIDAFLPQDIGEQAKLLSRKRHK